MTLPVLFIGRFQPLHKGHLYVLEEIFAREQRVFIVIGSAEACFTPMNPFTVGERIQMLLGVLDSLEIPCARYLIVPIPDIHNYSRWVQHIIQYLPPFGKVYTGSETVRKLFSEQGIPVTMIAHHRRRVLSGTEARRRLQKGKDWKAIVPPTVAKLVEEIDGAKRIKALAV
ncbi:MAG: nicotinamide-nucleotide adenylyltransferase [Promethearchaeota archaeon]